MRAESKPYYMLVASLPYMPRTFDVEHVPISRIRLDQRLTLLDDEDQKVVRQVQAFLLWDRQLPDRSDEDVQREYQRLMAETENPLVLEMINHRIDIRTIVSALRRRRRGLGPPAGVGRCVKQLQDNWQHPNFLLARQYPWIPRLREHLQENRPLEVERQLLQATWDYWVKLSDQYYFSFETVLLYLARWEIVDRWTRLDAAGGRQRFDDLLAEVVGNHAVEEF